MAGQDQRGRSGVAQHQAVLVLGELVVAELLAGDEHAVRRVDGCDDLEPGGHDCTVTVSAMPISTRSSTVCRSGQASQSTWSPISAPPSMSM